MRSAALPLAGGQCAAERGLQVGVQRSSGGFSELPRSGGGQTEKLTPRRARPNTTLFFRQGLACGRIRKPGGLRVQTLARFRVGTKCGCSST